MPVELNDFFALKPDIEDRHSWNGFVQRRLDENDENDQLHRYLKYHNNEYDEEDSNNDTEDDSEKKHHKHHKNKEDDSSFPMEGQALIDSAHELEEEKIKKKQDRYKKKHKKHLEQLRENPGIQKGSTHGFLIDAGSTGSRLHLYEFEPRVLRNLKEVELVVAGEKLSYPGTESRWTDRLSPGISTFATIEDDAKLLEAVGEYLSPLIEFAKSVLRTKAVDFDTFPIYLKATAGMRTLTRPKRERVMTAVRTLFQNKTYCPFQFEEEYARVISGEEEAVYGWTGVNFLMKTLLPNSQGSGTVMNPRLTYGALDMGGASTQISYYESIHNDDIMSNLFKLQIGAAKHWNLYAHSFLYFGINEAFNRFGARLAFDQSTEPAMVAYNPCLPGGDVYPFESRINLSAKGVEMWHDNNPEDESTYVSLLKNDNETGDFDQCSTLVRELLRKDANSWCDFAHVGDCSYAGVYQPPLPTQSTHFGEFLAFSNYYDVWNFLGLESRSTLTQLRDKTEYICNMSSEELKAYNSQKTVPLEDGLSLQCFRATYAFESLHNGYGFGMEDAITAANVINGQKVGWALGSMLYEINTLPWTVGKRDVVQSGIGWQPILYGLVVILFVLMTSFYVLMSHIQRGMRRRKYEQMKGFDGIEIEEMPLVKKDIKAEPRPVYGGETA